MKIKYLLSIILILQCAMPAHGMTRVCNIIRNSKVLLSTLTTRIPLFAKSLRTLPNKNLYTSSQRLFGQIPCAQNVTKNLLLAGTGLSLWGYNKLNSMTVLAQEEELKYSKEMVTLFHQFKKHLQTDNTNGAINSLFHMTKNIKEDGDYKILARCTNKYLMVAKDVMIQEAIQFPKDQIEKLLDAHINLAVMANGSMKAIEQNGYIIKFPEASADIFLAIREHQDLKLKFLEVITKLESQITQANKTDTFTRKEEIFIEIIGTIKSLLVDGLPQTA